MGLSQGDERDHPPCRVCSSTAPRWTQPIILFLVLSFFDTYYQAKLTNKLPNKIINPQLAFHVDLFYFKMHFLHA
jgi:hypothetical protein